MTVQDSVKKYQFVNDDWSDSDVAGMSGVERLIYRSNKLGDDQRITNTGGGNTSAKLMEKDPITGEDVEVLWVKGSGGDLRTSKVENFASLYQDQLMALQGVYARADNKGIKTPAEDNMVALYPHTVFNLNPRASSIDTPLHGFVPAKHVDHTHPISAIAVAASKDGIALMKEIYGEDLFWLPWVRPGFELGLMLEQGCQENPNAIGAIMGQHGLINWSDDDKECYYRSLDLIEKAAQYIESKVEENGGEEKVFGGAKFESMPVEIRESVFAKLLPWLRGQIVYNGQRLIATIEHDEKTLQYVNSKDAPRLAELGTSCPDHFLRTKIKPLYLDLSDTKAPTSEAEVDAFVKSVKDKLVNGLEQYRKDYSAYYDRCKKADSPAMRNPNPSVILVPGVGMIAWGKSKSEARVTAEFYGCAIGVMRGAEAISEYIALPEQEAFDIEYWALEEAKIQRMPPEKALDRQICVVIGAGSGIGKSVCQRISGEGAHIVSVDRDASSSKATADELTKKLGLGIGVSGTGISNCGPAISLDCDITNRESVREMLKQVVLAFGGIDHVAITAGLFAAPDKDGNFPDEMWAKSFAVNVTGSNIVAEEATKIWKEQGITGTLTLTTSANAVVSKKGSLAYDTSKAAANHLNRELAVELAPLVRVNAVAPATVVEGSSMFPKDRVMASLKKYDIEFSENESTEELRTKLAYFYAQRTLTKTPITLKDQSEAYFILMSGKLSKTVGQVIAVDGGLHEAFLR